MSPVCSGDFTRFEFVGMGLAIGPTMNLRITEFESVEGTSLRIDGRLETDSLNELERACEEAQLPLTLNLEGLMWIDDRGAETLRRLMAGGTVVMGASPFVALQLTKKEEIHESE